MNTIISIAGGAIIGFSSILMGLHVDWRIAVVGGSGYVLGRIAEMVEHSRAEPK